MGLCVSAKSEAIQRNFNDKKQTVFDVEQVCRNGDRIQGTIEVLLDGLAFICLHRQISDLYWPFNSLRSYKCVADSAFMFESGHQCATGPGTFLFQLRYPEKLFSAVEEAICRKRLITPTNSRKPSAESQSTTESTTIKQYNSNHLSAMPPSEKPLNDRSDEGADSQKNNESPTYSTNKVLDYTEVVKSEPRNSNAEVLNKSSSIGKNNNGNGQPFSDSTSSYSDKTTTSYCLIDIKKTEALKNVVPPWKK